MVAVRVLTPNNDEALAREHARSVLKSSGSTRQAARELGISREAYLALVAGAHVSRGTVALVLQRARNQ